MIRLCCFLITLLSAPLFSKQRPNVLFIICDDLNDYVSAYDSHPQVKTPNLKKFAQSAVTFKHAYSNNPVCAPSRASLFTGVYPHDSGNLFWQKWYEQKTLKHCKTMMELFVENAYNVMGTGKLLHHERPALYSEFKNKANYGPYWLKDGKTVAHPDVPEPFADIGAIDGSFGSIESAIPKESKTERWFSGDWKSIKKPFNFEGPDRDLTPDELNAKWVAERLKALDKSGSEQAFFMAVGFVRPHTPLHVPQKYFDMFPIDQIQLPEILENDAKDTHYTDVFDSDQKGLKYFDLLKKSYPNWQEGLKAFTQAYLASIAAVDENIGQVLNALDQSRFKDNTIVIFTSDHGWNMGEKDYLFKNSPWEESGRVPFIVRAPQIAKAGSQAQHPVSLIDIYPTLVDLCGLEGDNRKNESGVKLGGFSIRPFLENPQSMEWQGPKGALTMIYAGPHTGMDPDLQHWTWRTKDFRYIRYNNGQEELYDHTKDPRELTNLAKNPEYAQIKAELKEDLISFGQFDFSKPISSPKKKTVVVKKNSAREKKDGEYWKKNYFKNNPSADANKDGKLSWKELNDHKKAK
ncbi:sulfatase [Lentisphaera marina]|uniref:sulfatase n=1 Tax=Lentisphaera marina TaxID=1111041 RepID=UPI0023651E13|nr:sulfatase [Lentisphaera marina]MDD7984014.1 sulfatase [Lentisphaera marina]